MKLKTEFIEFYVVSINQKYIYTSSLHEISDAVSSRFEL